MQTYSDTDCDSNVEAYEKRNTAIVVKFKNGTNQYYEYTHSSAGSSHVEHMKILASQGDGLNAYINHNQPGYECKW